MSSGLQIRQVVGSSLTRPHRPGRGTPTSRRSGSRHAVDLPEGYLCRPPAKLLAVMRVSGVAVAEDVLAAGEGVHVEGAGPVVELTPLRGLSLR